MGIEESRDAANSLTKQPISLAEHLTERATRSQICE